MGRGLGHRQRLLLSALADLEREHGPGCFMVATVLNRAWEMGMLEQHEAERQAAAIEHQAYITGLREKAAAGDRDAKRELLTERRLEVFAIAIRRRRPAPHTKRRWPRYFDEALNPSRCFALLERRKLVERPSGGRPGRGWVGLTDAGREMALRSEEDRPF